MQKINNENNNYYNNNEKSKLYFSPTLKEILAFTRRALLKQVTVDLAYLDNTIMNLWSSDSRISLSTIVRLATLALLEDCAV